MDRDAICDRYKQLNNRLSSSKSLEDKKVYNKYILVGPIIFFIVFQKLEQVIGAYNQLISQAQRQMPTQELTLNAKNKHNKSKLNLN